MAELQIEIPGDLLHAVQSAVDSGQYTSSNEVALEALQDWHDRQHPDIDLAVLVQGLEKSVKEDAPGEDPEEVFARLRARYTDPRQPVE